MKIIKEIEYARLTAGMHINGDVDLSLLSMTTKERITLTSKKDTPITIAGIGSNTIHKTYGKIRITIEEVE